MIRCEYDDYTSRSQSGMAMHVRSKHPDKWNGHLKSSFSDGFDMGTPERGIYTGGWPRKKKKVEVVRAVVGKGEKKPPIKQKCPWCIYKSTHPPGLAHHIKKAHPKKWKGRLSITLGMPPTTSDKYLDKKKLQGSRPYKQQRKQQLAGQVRIPNNYCMECGADQRPAQLAKGFMTHDNRTES
jgi:hypothetical protein